MVTNLKVVSYIECTAVHTQIGHPGQVAQCEEILVTTQQYGVQGH